MFTQAFKRLIAKTSVAAVLFTQLAVAAYACPAVDSPAALISAAVAGDMQTAMPGCEMSGSGNSNLCLQHCQTGDQSAQVAPQASILAVAATSALLVIEPALPQANFRVAVLSALPERETSPPPLIRFGVLRI